MVIYYKKWKTYNEIQLTKKNGLKYSKNDKSSTLPRKFYYKNYPKWEKQEICFFFISVSWMQNCWFSYFFMLNSLQDELRLLLTTCNFTILFYDALKLEAGIMDT